ncbi:MAG: ABC transporter permease [Natronincolaceae bacterium]|jgi:ABC-2 type transport system permease protein|nr:ABC transporter permease [Bacillota bacterium]NLK90029.1 ABC transporter permease [Clostridiales bacterium]
MKNILRNSIYLGKNMFRDMSFTFWGLMYPIILAGFFYIAFSGIINMEIKTINVGIGRENQAYPILENVEILNVMEIHENDAEKSLKSGKIDGYIKNDLTLVVDGSGLNQTVIKGILDQIIQIIALNEPMQNLDFEVNYLSAKTQEANPMLVIFYSLIAMVSTYGVFPGIETAVTSQANLTDIGARINTTPIKKSTLLISGVIDGLLINIFSNILLLLFLRFVLKMDLFTNIWYSGIFILLGNLFGVSLGIFVGSSNKKSPGVKVMFSIATTLFLSFLSGMMSPNIKVSIDKNVPILGKINPISIITNSLYKINLLGNTRNLSQGMILLAVYSLVLMAVSYLFLGRSQYDSI